LDLTGECHGFWLDLDRGDAAGIPDSLVADDATRDTGLLQGSAEGGQLGAVGRVRAGIGEVVGVGWLIRVCAHQSVSFGVLRDGSGSGRFGAIPARPALMRRASPEWPQAGCSPRPGCLFSTPVNDERSSRA